MHTRTVATAMVAALAAIAGCGSEEASEPEGPPRSVEIAAVEYAFEAKESITITAGETIEFVVSNEGSLDHELEVLTDANRRLGKTERIAPGDSASVVVTFDDAGVYRVICDIDDHRSRGQQAEFTVFESSDSS